MRSSMGSVICSREIQFLIFIFAGTIMLLLLVQSQSETISRSFYDGMEKVSEPLIGRKDNTNTKVDVVDYSLCSPRKPFRLFVYEHDHPLAQALLAHPAVTDKPEEACAFIAFTDKGTIDPLSQWDQTGKDGGNHLIINFGDSELMPTGNEWIAQKYFSAGQFRQQVDFSFFPDVEPFDNSTYLSRPYIMPLKRHSFVAIVTDSTTDSDSSNIEEVECDVDCESSLESVSFCLLPDSVSFQARLLSSLRAGCIPVVMSTSAQLPFQDQLDWKLAAFRFPASMLESVPEMLEEIQKEDVMEMRRRGRVFLARFDDAEALSKSLVAAIADRLYLNLPVYPEVKTNLIAPNDEFKNFTSNITRIRSDFGAQTLVASRLYGYNRWNTGRDLTYTPRTLHDVPQMPGEAGFYEGTKDHLVSVNGKPKLGLTRDEEQFTVMILTYNRDKGVQTIIERLRDCPYLNKIIIVWNNLERRPNGTWPDIHVPIEFFLSSKNTLNSRFLPYDRIETEAVVSIDDDMDLGHPEITFAFRMWRENRDRVVGFPDRYHKFKNGKGAYGVGGSCEHSMILTSFAFFHKEFLFEYSYNQHPVILDYIDKNRNCEDIAINYLISHLTRKPPLKVVKKRGHNNGSKSGLSARGDHYKERDGCVAMFNRIYGYSPLLFTQEVAKPDGNCVEGL